MERKNMVLLTVIAVATLLVAVVGATFAYFTATVEDQRSSGDNDGTANITAGSVASTTVVGNVSNAAGKFTAEGVYPGHKEVAGLSVTVSNESEQEITTNTKVNIVYDVTTNEFQKDEIEVSVYKATDDLSLSENYFGCTHTEDPQTENTVHFSETCTNDVEDLKSLGATELTSTPVKLSGGQQSKLVLATDTITAEGQSTEKTVNYYVVVEFKETSTDQNKSMNAKLVGKISVEVA